MPHGTVVRKTGRGAALARPEAGGREVLLLGSQRDRNIFVGARVLYDNIKRLGQDGVDEARMYVLLDKPAQQTKKPE